MTVRQLAKSMLSFSWAASLYGAERMMGWMVPGRRHPRAWLAESLDEVSSTAHRQLGDRLGLAFQLGDDLQREWLDRLTGPRGVFEAAGEFAASSRAIWRIASPGREAAALRGELRNKFEVYRLVKGVSETLGLPPVGAQIELHRFVDRAYELEPYPAMWALEGLGHHYMKSALRRERRPRGLLTHEDLPRNALLMLHAGLGLAVAEVVLEELAPRPARAAAHRALERFAELCRENSRPDFEDAALEALGLVARCFYPDLVMPLHRGLDEGDGILHAYFWHGVGRAIYFVPVNFLPGYGSAWHAIEMARREAPNAEASTNALNGVAFAVTLVNLSDPGVLESLFRHHGDELRGTSFSEGMASSVLMRRTTTPEDRDLARFLARRPGAPGSRMARLWHELVVEPCEEALGPEGPPHEKSTPAGEVYRALSEKKRFEGVVRGGGERP